MGLVVVGAAQGGELPPIRPSQHALEAPRHLQLAIVINGEDLNLIEAFTFYPASGRLSAKRFDLEQAGIRTPRGGREQILFLDTLGATFRYDEARQKIEFTLSDAQRTPRLYDAQIGGKKLRAHADVGALFNYSLFGGTIRDLNTRDLIFSGANAQLDARVFGDYGLFEQTGVVGSTVYGDGRNLLRLDSTYGYSDQDSAISYRAGDVISGGTAWTRPIRLAGGQVARDFGLRSDIVTRPLPQVSGTAATPSTVDVLVNGVRAFSQQVAAGPYSIANIPVISSGGDAQVVIRDSTGRTVQQNLTLFNSTNLLAPTLSDFSLEFGLARRNYGALSMDYDRQPIGSGTYRYGALRWLTLETHAEGGAGLANLGAGAEIGLGRFGATTLAVSGSHSPAGGGGQVYFDWRMNWLPFSFSFGTQRALSNYDDLASATADPTPVASTASPTNFGYIPLAAPATTLAGLRPPRALDRAAVSFPLFDDKTSFSVGAVNLVQQDRSSSRLLIGSASRTLGWSQARLFVSTFADLGSQKSFGAFAGLSFNFSDGVSGSLGANYDPASKVVATADIGKSQQPIDDTAGWRVRAAGVGPGTALEADGSYRSSVGQISATALQTKTATSGTAQFDGSIAWIGGSVVAGNRVDSSFALVDAGRPGVSVMQDNHLVGKTGGDGKYLAPNLRAYEPNHIGVDPTGAPIDFDVATTDEVVSPRGKSGVYLKFGDGRHGQTAIVVFVDALGKPLTLGARGRLEGKTETFLIGHDGRAYIRGLNAANVAIVEADAGECRAPFAFAPVEGRQTIVRGVVCR